MQSNKTKKINIELAKNAGFCFGVKRALKMVEDNLQRFKKPIKMYGYLVHNEYVVNELVEKGIEIIDSLKNVDKGTLIITAHGISPKIKDKLKKNKNLNLLDTTCPMVLKTQDIARNFVNNNIKVIIFGDYKHQEVLGINGAADDKAIIFSSNEEFLKIKFDKNKIYGLISQTTQDFKKFQDIKKIAQKMNNIEVADTVCKTTQIKQREIMDIARRNQVIFIIGSQMSANTKRLYQISSKINAQTYFIRDANDLDIKLFEKAEKIGIGAGASTPDWIINSVIKKIYELSENR